MDADGQQDSYHLAVDLLSQLGSWQGIEAELQRGGGKGGEVDFEAVGGGGEVGPIGRGVGIEAEEVKDEAKE